MAWINSWKIKMFTYNIIRKSKNYVIQGEKSKEIDTYLLKLLLAFDLTYTKLSRFNILNTSRNRRRSAQCYYIGISNLNPTVQAGEVIEHESKIDVVCIKHKCNVLLRRLDWLSEGGLLGRAQVTEWQPVVKHSVIISFSSSDRKCPSPLTVNRL